MSQGNLMIFINFPSMLIVGGGVFAATMINYGIEAIKISFTVVKNVLTAKDYDLRTDIELMNMFSRKVRKDGLLMLEDDVQNIDHGFLKNGLQLAIDGVTKDSLENILIDQIRSLTRRYEKSCDVLDAMANFSPAFGMIGTVIGLVLMLQNISDPNTLATGLSVALITTFYGTVLANMVFGPLAGKVGHTMDIENGRYEMFKIAIMSIVNEENPRIMEKKMLSYVEPDKRAEYIHYYDTQSKNKKRDEVLYKNWIHQQGNQWEELLKVLETG